jgi:hypothetical protein
MMKKMLLFITVFAVLFVGTAAQKKYKPWNEWSDKDALKMLNDSAWGQTQTETNTSEMFYNPTTQGGRGASSDRNAQGATNQAVNVNYRIRFLSAKPIRQAFARSILLQQKSPNTELEERLKAFAEQKTQEWIVLAVDFDETDRRFSGPAMQIFNSANTGALQNNTYLEIKDGKRVFLKEYRAPINDGMGAKYIFPRLVEGKPFVTTESGYLRFYCELTKDIKLNMRFKVQDMMYDGQLEY